MAYQQSNDISGVTLTVSAKVNFPGSNGTSVIVQPDDDTSSIENDYIDPVYGNLDFEYTLDYNFTYEAGDEQTEAVTITEVNVEITETDPDVSTTSSYKYPLQDIGIIDFTTNYGGDLKSIRAVKNLIEPFPGQSYKFLVEYVEEDEFQEEVTQEEVIDYLTGDPGEETSVLDFYQPVSDEDLEYLATQEAADDLDEDIEDNQFTAEDRPDDVSEEDWAEYLEQQAAAEQFVRDNSTTWPPTTGVDQIPTVIPGGQKVYKTYTYQEVVELNDGEYEAITEWNQPEVKDYDIFIRISGKYTSATNTNPVDFYIVTKQLVKWDFNLSLDRFTELVEGGNI